MRAGDILKAKGAKVETLPDTARLGEAIERLAALNIGALLIVTADSAPCGILSERDIVRILAGAPTGHRDRPVREVMTGNLITCKPDDTVDELLDRMTDRRIRHLPVMDGTSLVGILSIGDVVKHRIREATAEAEALKTYITSG
ncbi:MAG: CBS domain-containing protein [Parvularcula sp.]|jgi:CBS domain-containing protein|nr:CBS domain-containing protein [Parvularcula sp.]